MVRTQLCEGQKGAYKAFLIAHAQMNRACERAIEASGQIPLEVFDVLATLESAPHERLRMSELAERVLLSRSGLSRLVDRMETRGLIRREGCPSDKRGSYALITDEGRKARAEAWVVLAGVIEQVWGSEVQGDQCGILTELFARVSARAQATSSP